MSKRKHDKEQRSIRVLQQW